jgi:hypothetical protein
LGIKVTNALKIKPFTGESQRGKSIFQDFKSTIILGSDALATDEFLAKLNGVYGWQLLAPFVILNLFQDLFKHGTRSRNEFGMTAAIERARCYNHLNNSFKEVLERVFSSTRLIITAHWSPGLVGRGSGSTPGTTTE